MNNKVLPVHVLRLYIWELLKLNLNWTEVNNLVPIVPVEDEPKLAESGKNYIVYGYAENNDTPSPIRSATISLRITANTFGELGEIVTTITRALETGDMAAENINLWSSGVLNGALTGIRITSVRAVHVESGEADDKEGGESETIVNVSFDYISTQTVKLPVSGGLWDAQGLGRVS